MTVSRRVKRVFDQTTLRPTKGPRVASKVDRSLSAAISPLGHSTLCWAAGKVNQKIVLNTWSRSYQYPSYKILAF